MARPDEPRPLMFWSSGGSLCARGGLALTWDDSCALLQLYEDERMAALAAGNIDLAARACVNAFDLTTARIASQRWIRASDGASQ